MVLLWDVVELPVVGFAAWTLAYHLTVLLALPARRMWVVATALALPLLWVVMRGRRREPRRMDGLVAASLLLAVAAGAVTFLSSSPNLDDVSFFHRALVQLHHRRQPFLLADTLHDAAGVPPLSMLHALTSYEPLMAMAGHALGLDPLWTYQRVGAFAAAALLAVVLVLLASELGGAPRRAPAVAAVALAFLALDGNVGRTFGCVAFPRFWQGKCILWSALLPATLLFVHRFLRAPTARHLALVALAGVSAVGLSGSGTVLFPGMVLCASLAFVAANGAERRTVAAAVRANLASVYPFALGLAFATGTLARPDMATWANWEPVWWRNLYVYVVGDARTLVRDLVLLCVPAFALRGPERRFLLLLPVAVGVVFLNPEAGPVVLRAVTPANYWRLAYLIPLPLYAGMVVSCFADGCAARAAGAAALLAVGWAFQSSSLFRSPFPPTFGPVLPLPERRFASVALPHLHPGDRVLAPESVVWTLALLAPQLRFVAGRTIETPGLFRTAGRADEGIRRSAAQAAVDGWGVTDAGRAGLREALARGLRAVVAPVAQEPTVLALLVEAGATATVAARDERWVLLLLPRRTRRAGGQR